MFPLIILLVFILVSPAQFHAVQQSRSTDAHLLRGLAFLDKDSYEEAIKEFSRSVAANPKDAEPRYQLGLAQWKLGRPTEASANFVQALQLAPHHALAWYYLGRTFLQAENLPKAVESFEKAIQSANGKPAVDEYFQLGKTYLSLKEARAQRCERSTRQGQCYAVPDPRAETRGQRAEEPSGQDQ
ncbi:MAG: tetratricopeptide repeat protein [Acidobacteria bacterium]|nr:tetratricopeptide repeat protein [Acidobacteriota bacterium]